RQRLRDRTVLLRLLCGTTESLVVDPRDTALDRQGDLRNPLARLERDLSRRLELLRRVPGLRKPMRQRHRETRGVRGGDQLFWTRLAARFLRASRPADVEPTDCTARHTLDRAASTHQITLPGDLRTSLSRHLRLRSFRSLCTRARERLTRPSPDN